MGRHASRLPGAIAAGLLLLAIVSFGTWHHLTGARFVVTATLVTDEEAFNRCVDDIQPSSGQASTACTKPETAAQCFRLDIRNAGGRGAWIGSCYVAAPGDGGSSGSDSANREVHVFPRYGIPVPPYVAPGDSVTLYWYAESSMHHAQASSLSARCSSVVYKYVPA